MYTDVALFFLQILGVKVLQINRNIANNYNSCYYHLVSGDFSGSGGRIGIVNS